MITLDASGRNTRFLDVQKSPDVHNTIYQLQLSKHIAPTEVYHLNVRVHLYVLEYRMTRTTADGNQCDITSTFRLTTLFSMTRVCNSTHQLRLAVKQPVLGLIKGYEIIYVY